MSIVLLRSPDSTGPGEDELRRLREVSENAEDAMERLDAIELLLWYHGVLPFPLPEGYTPYGEWV